MKWLGGLGGKTNWGWSDEWYMHAAELWRPQPGTPKAWRAPGVTQTSGGAEDLIPDFVILHEFSHHESKLRRRSAEVFVYKGMLKISIIWMVGISLATQRLFQIRFWAFPHKSYWWQHQRVHHCLDWQWFSCEWLKYMSLRYCCDHSYILMFRTFVLQHSSFSVDGGVWTAKRRTRSSVYQS